MKFEVRPLMARAPGGGQREETGEHAIFAVDPRQGNDAALLAVFDNPRSSQELARFLNWAYDKYLREAPMEAATETRISPGGARPAESNLPAGWIRTGAHCTCRDFPGADEFCMAHKPPTSKCPEHQWWGGRMAERKNQAAPAPASNDPNMAGSDQTKGVRDSRAGRMTPSDEYDQNEPYHKPTGTA
jgi:hypothetical protein